MERIWRTAIVALALLGPGGVTAAAAQTKPTCAIVVPNSNNQTLSGAIGFSASATNAATVDYYANGVYLGAAVPTIYGWIYTWDSPTVSNGTYGITCVATSSTGQKGTSAKRNVIVANQVGCSMLIPTGDDPIFGTATALDAVPTIQNATKVELYLHTSSRTTIPLGTALPTIYGYLYTPNNGQTWGWDSTAYADGVYGMSCVATAANGTRTSSATVSFTLDNSTSHTWPSFCLGHLPADPSDYEAAFDYRAGGWAGADGGGDIPLPDGRVLWLFGDTLVGPIDADHQWLAPRNFPRNSVQVQSQHCFTPLLRGTPSAPNSDSFFPNPDANHWFWPSGGFLDTSGTEDVVRVMLTRLKFLPRTCGSVSCSAAAPTCPSGEVCNLANNLCNSSSASCSADSDCHVAGETCQPPGGWNWALEGMDIATLSLPDLAITSIVPTPPDGVAGVPLFGAGSTLRTGSYVYLYGGGANGYYVARAPAGNFVGGAWRYWAGGTTWSTNPASAQPMALAPGSPDASLGVPGFDVVKYGSGYLATGKVGLEGFATSIVRGWYSKQPYGPWHAITDSNNQPVHLVPEITFPGSPFYYGGRSIVDVPGTAAASPMIVFSTNGDSAQPGLGVLVYGPHFADPIGLPTAAELAAMFPN